MAVDNDVTVSVSGFYRSFVYLGKMLSTGRICTSKVHVGFYLVSENKRPKLGIISQTRSQIPRRGSWSTEQRKYRMSSQRKKRASNFKFPQRYNHDNCYVEIVGLVGWLVVLRINVDLAIFQPYLDLEAWDNQSLKIQVARPGIEPRSSYSASQELNHSADAAPWNCRKNKSKMLHVTIFFNHFICHEIILTTAQTNFDFTLSWLNVHGFAYLQNIQISFTDVQYTVIQLSLYKMHYMVAINHINNIIFTK